MTTWEEWRAKQTPQTQAATHGVSYWRRESARVIALALDGFTGTEDELRAKLRELYPFGERKYWPYKCWLDEQRFAIRHWKSRHRTPHEGETGQEKP